MKEDYREQLEGIRIEVFRVDGEKMPGAVRKIRSRLFRKTERPSGTEGTVQEGKPESAGLGQGGVLLAEVWLTGVVVLYLTVRKKRAGLKKKGELR